VPGEQLAEMRQRAVAFLPDVVRGLLECCLILDHLPTGLTEPYVRPTPKVRRNDPCPCGSGKKYKKCCLGADADQ
jgi:uncharacterized protein YecA (UPF0149 family)